MFTQVAEYSLAIVGVRQVLPSTSARSCAFWLDIQLTCSTTMLLRIYQVISIGHLSAGPIDLAASSLASMTASVSAFSILQGIASARTSSPCFPPFEGPLLTSSSGSAEVFYSSVDTLLPAAWTSSDPTRVGLWTQRVAIICLGAMLPIIEIWWNAESVSPPRTNPPV